MKVLFITHRFPRLYNTFIANEVGELERIGIECRILSLWRGDSEVQNSSTERLGLLRKTVYLDEFDTRTTSRAVTESTLLSEAGSSIGGFLDRLETVAAHILEQKFKILHGAFGNTPATAALCLSLHTGIPFTFETHAYDLFVDFPFAREKMNRAGFLMTESFYNQRYLTDALSCDPAKIRIIRLSPDRDAIAQVGPKAKDSNLLVSTSRLHEIKGVRYAIEALPLILRRFPDVHYKIIGDGPELPVLQKLVMSLELGGQVEFLGALPSRHALEWTAKASALLHPSIVAANGDRDGTPTAVAEAMWLKTPVVATPVGGISEMLVDGVSGYLVPSGSSQELAERCLQILSEPNKARAMTEEAFSRAQDLFDLERNTRMLIQEWSKL